MNMCDHCIIASHCHRDGSTNVEIAWGVVDSGWHVSGKVCGFLRLWPGNGWVEFSPVYFYFRTMVLPSHQKVRTFFVLGSSVILFFTPSWRKTWPQPWEPHPWNRNRKGAQLRFFSPFMCFLGQRVMTHVFVVHVSIWKCWSEDSFVIVDGMDQNTLWL